MSRKMSRTVQGDDHGLSAEEFTDWLFGCMPPDLKAALGESLN